MVLLIWCAEMRVLSVWYWNFSVPDTWCCIIYLFLLLIKSPIAVNGLRLNEFVSHYEPVSYQLTAPLYSSVFGHRTRFRRSSIQSSPRPPPPLSFQFRAHNREFRVRLRPDPSVLSQDVQFFRDDVNIEFDRNQVYSGSMEGEELSSVYGVIGDDGVFDGVLNTGSETYYLEPSSRYYNHDSTTVPDPASLSTHHSLIYRASDVHVPLNHSGCHEDHRVPSHQQSDHTGSGDPSLTGSKNETARYGQDIVRVRRSVSGSERVKGKRTTCLLYLQADHLFSTQMGSEEASIQAMIKHVQQLNDIYRYVDFDSDGIQDNINFIIKRIRVHSADSLKNPLYRYKGHYSVEKFLEIFSAENYDSFCLAYMFTYRDFQGGTLGLAWTGDLQQAGGVCQRHGHYRGAKRSLNTGVVSVLNYGKRVPPAVSHVTFAHEIGHSFGSKHDPEDDPECVPGGLDGNYLMYARATSGDKRNNKMFSPCSVRSIYPVLRKRAISDRGCFTVPQAAICGNGVVEKGEQCDCGWDSDCQEQCCRPMSSDPKLARRACTLKPSAVCSPSQGPCCDSSCHLVAGTECRQDNGCRSNSTCSGLTASCPPSKLRPDTTICDQQSVCYRGECSGSICLAFGLEPCQCTPDPGDPDTKACELCCKEPGINTECRSSFTWNALPFNVPDLHLKPGSPCLQHTGYCDVFQICRQVDPIGPLSTIKQWLLSRSGLSAVKEFIDSYWYLIALALVALILFLVAVIRIFGRSDRYRRRRRRRKTQERSKRNRENKTTDTSGNTDNKITENKEKTVELKKQADDDSKKAAGRRLKKKHRASHLMPKFRRNGLNYRLTKLLLLDRLHSSSRRRKGRRNFSRKRRHRTLSDMKQRRKESSVQIISYTNRTDDIAQVVSTEADTKVANIPLISNTNDKTKHAHNNEKYRKSTRNTTGGAQKKSEAVERGGEGNRQDRGRSTRKGDGANYVRSLSQQISTGEHEPVARLRSRSSSPTKRKVAPGEITGKRRPNSGDPALKDIEVPAADSKSPQQSTSKNVEEIEQLSPAKKATPRGDKSRRNDAKQRRYHTEKPQTKYNKKRPDAVRDKTSGANAQRNPVKKQDAKQPEQPAVTTRQHPRQKTRHAHKQNGGRLRLLPDKIAKKLLGRSEARSGHRKISRAEERIMRSNEHVLQWLRSSVTEDACADLISLASTGTLRRRSIATVSPSALSRHGSTPLMLPAFSHASTPQAAGSQDQDPLATIYSSRLSLVNRAARLTKSQSMEGVGTWSRPMYRRSVSQGTFTNQKSGDTQTSSTKDRQV